MYWDGQLGDRINKNSFTPVQVKKGGVALTNIADIAAGNDHTSVILNASAEMYCFGADNAGQLCFSGEQNVKKMALSVAVSKLIKESVHLSCQSFSGFATDLLNLFLQKVTRIVHVMSMKTKQKIVNANGR